MKFDLQKFEALPICVSPSKLEVDGLKIQGLMNFILTHKKIAIHKDHIPGRILDSGLFKYATFGEDSMRRIHAQILNDTRRFEDWDSPMTYIRKCEGIGVSRISILIYAATGKLPPAPVLCAIKFLGDVLIPGTYELYGQKQSGSTFVPREVFTQFIDNWNAQARYEQDKVDPTDILEALLGSVSLVRDNSGTIRWLGENDSLLGEAAFMAISGMESNWSVEPPPMTNEHQYTDEQDAGINGILGTNRVACVLTGAGGTGKTTVLRRVVMGFNRAGIKVLAMAPTGAAVVRMRSQIGDLIDSTQIGTIHRFIYTGQDELLSHISECGVVIIDEASMLDSRTFGKLFWKLTRTREKPGERVLSIPKFVFSGDNAQLPPVGSGEGFSDLIDLRACPIFKLTKVMRTSDPAYLEFFNAIRNGQWADPRNAFNVVGASKDNFAQKIAEMVDQLYADHGPTWYEHTAVIGFRNGVIDRINSLCYSRLVNRVLALPKLNRNDPTGSDTPDQCHWGAVGCRVMFTVNDPLVGVVNGDTGTVMGSREGRRGIETQIKLDSGGTVEVGENYGSIKLGWARTVHKAQGAEFHRVWFVNENWLETRRLIYTAVTRAKVELNFLMQRPSQFKMETDPTRLTAIKHGMEAWGSLYKILMAGLRGDSLSCPHPRLVGNEITTTEDSNFGECLPISADDDELPF